MAKKTKNLNLPIITSDDYETTKVVDMVDDIQGDKEGSAFNIIDSAFETKQDKLTINPSTEASDTISKLTVDGTTYKLATDVDSQMSGTSTNPVQNKVVNAALADKASLSQVQTLINEAVYDALNRNY